MFIRIEESAVEKTKAPASFDTSQKIQFEVVQKVIRARVADACT
jgi:hypothetical protein